MSESSRSSRPKSPAKAGGEALRPPRTRLLNVRAESPELDFRLLELSPIGLSIETSSRLEVGTRLPFRLWHKDGHVDVEGEVRWCRLHLTSEVGGPRSPRYRAGFSLSGEGVAAGGMRSAALASQPPTASAERRRRAEERDEAEKIERIREVLDRRLQRVVYQPIFSLRRGEVYGHEALARCPIPGLERLPEVYRIAALAGLVGELGRQHRSQAVAEAPEGALFLNVNPHEFDYGWLVQPDDPIFRHPFPVFVEVTENVPLVRFEQCLAVLDELRAKGVGVAIDDLGAGFSNLRYLAELVPDFVKLDRSLIAGLGDSSRRFLLVESIVGMCRKLGASVIAEGVESVDELVAAERAGVDYCQGYLLGRPDLPAGFSLQTPSAGD